MTNRIFISISIFVFFFASINFISCSKPSAVTPADPCAGKTIAITATTTATTGGTNNGTINATATGSSGFTYSSNAGAFQGSGSFTNLAVGSYSIVAKDADGCTGTQSFTVTATPCPNITINATITPASSPTATNGAINATATGSTGFTYSKDGVIFQPTGVFTGLSPISYNITAKDVNGCTASTAFLVTNTLCPTISVTFTTINTAGPTAITGSITASATGGVGPYTYSLIVGTFQQTGLFSNLAAGTNYSVVAKDVNGCQGASSAITVASNPCPTINFTQIITGSDKCATTGTGSINVTATGSTGFTYSKDGVTFQASNIFTGLTAINYNITVKDLNGCVKTGPVAVNQLPAGPLFTAVKGIMTANCVSCHGGSSPQSGINFGDDCMIVLKSGRIKARAVDGIPSIMPQSGAISAADKQKIVDWINGGGQHSN